MRLAALLLLAIGVAAGIWDSLSREAGEKGRLRRDRRKIRVEQVELLLSQLRP